MASLAVWLAIGGVIGWLGGQFMRTAQDPLLNVIAGISGALLGGFLVSPLIGAAVQTDFTLLGLAASTFCAAFFLCALSFVHAASWSVPRR